MGCIMVIEGMPRVVWTELVNIVCVGNILLRTIEYGLVKPLSQSDTKYE